MTQIKAIMIKLVVLDLLDTSVSDNGLYIESLESAFYTEGIITNGINKSIVAGKRVIDAIKDLYMDIMLEVPDNNVVRNIYTDFKHKINSAYDSQQVSLLNGTNSFLYFLQKKGIKSVIVSDLDRFTSIKILHRLGIYVERDIDMLVTSDMVVNSKPSSAMIDYALEHYKIKPGDCITVGDSINDVKAGKNAGVRASVGVVTGAHTYTELQQNDADYVVSELGELQDIIREVNNRF